MPARESSTFTVSILARLLSRALRGGDLFAANVVGVSILARLLSRALLVGGGTGDPVYQFQSSPGFSAGRYGSLYKYRGYQSLRPLPREPHGWGTGTRVQTCRELVQATNPPSVRRHANRPGFCQALDVRDWQSNHQRSIKVDLSIHAIAFTGLLFGGGQAVEAQAIGLCIDNVHELRFQHFILHVVYRALEDGLLDALAEILTYLGHTPQPAFAGRRHRIDVISD